MKKVLVLVGLPASGKSTFAHELLLKEPGQWVLLIGAVATKNLF
jgi:predicted kinase